MTLTSITSKFLLLSDTMATAVQLFAIDPLLDEVDALAGCARTSHHGERHNARETLIRWRELINHARRTLQPHLQQMTQELYQYIRELDEEPSSDPKLVLEQKNRSSNSEMLLETMRLFDDYCLAHVLLEQKSPTYRSKIFTDFDVQGEVSKLLTEAYQLILNFDPTYLEAVSEA